MSGGWEELERPGPDTIEVGGIRLRAGARVRLRPHAGGDIFDVALDGRTAVIEAIEQDLEGHVNLAVVVEDDPGADLGYARLPGHRFFFSPAEVQPLEPDPPASEPGERPAARILIAGLGNVFLGDDGFGVALAQRLARRRLAPGVEVVDFGIRGMDLAFAMQEGYDAVVLLDAAPRGNRPGTLYVVEIDPAEHGAAGVDAHGMDPGRVLGLLRAFGGVPPRTYLVGCEPREIVDADVQDVVAGLSEPVRAALDPAIELVRSLLSDIIGQPTHPKEASGR